MLVEHPGLELVAACDYFGDVVAEDRLIALDALVSKVLNPFERMFGFSLLGAQTVQTLQRFPEGRFF